MDRKNPKLKVLELYSGIGGLHFALQEIDLPYEVVAAADLNNIANKIYKHNFGDVKLITKCIEAITVQEFNKFGVDLLHMSPPCQPYCRMGKKKDVADDRTKSFLYLLSVLPKLEKPIDYIFVENVKGFETSESRDLLLATLKDLHYHVQEFLLSPLQFGVPNSRLRYYLIAKREPLQFHFPTNDQIRTDIPDCVLHYLVHRQNCPESASRSTLQNQTTVPPDIKTKDQHGATNLTTYQCHCILCHNRSKSESNMKKRKHEKICDDASNVDPSANSVLCNSVTENYSVAQSPDSSVQSQTSTQHELNIDQSEESPDTEGETNQSELPLYEKCRHLCKTIDHYLENHSEESLSKCLLPEKYFKRFWVLDLVTKESRNCCCFTKRYGRHMDGSGSIIEVNTSDTVDLSYYKQKDTYDDVIHEAVRARKLRFFSPREIANLMCFPQSFSIPEDMTHMQMYRCLGNSLNVHVVAVLLRLLTHGDAVWGTV